MLITVNSDHYWLVVDDLRTSLSFEDGNRQASTVAASLSWEASALRPVVESHLRGGAAPAAACAGKPRVHHVDGSTDGGLMAVMLHDGYHDGYHG